MSELSGLTELSLEPNASTSSRSMRYTLQSPTGLYLHMSNLELTSNPKRARLITAAQAENIRRLWSPAKALILRVGVGK